MAKRVPSVQWRIMARQLPLLALLFGVVLYWLGAHLESLLEEADLKVARNASLLTTSVIQAKMMTAGEHEAWSRVLEGLPVEDRIEVVDSGGGVLFATDPSRIGHVYDPTGPTCTSCHGDGTSTVLTETALIHDAGPEGDQKVFATPLTNNDACRTCHSGRGPKLGMVLVNRSPDAVDRQVQTIQLALVLAGLVAFLLTVATTRVLLGRYLGRPVKKLVAGAEAIGSGRLRERIELPERTELSLLADALNHSAAKLTELFGTLSRQRDDFATLYDIVDQLSRAVRPKDRRLRSVELASRVLKKECALVRVDPRREDAPYTVTYRSADGAFVDLRIREGAEIPSYVEPAAVSAWGAGEFNGKKEVCVGGAIAYPLSRGGRDQGLLLAPAGDFATTGASADPGMVDALMKHLAIALAYSGLQREFVDQERLAAVGETVAALSHCLKNLLNGLRAGIYVTNRARELEDAAKFEMGWRVLVSSVAQVERLTFDMLYYVKERPPNREPVDPNEVMTEVAGLTADMAEVKGVHIRTKLDETIGLVPLDRTAIYRAVLNLVTNAIDACTESETGELVFLRSSHSDEGIVLEVQDDGAGMPDAVKERLFTRLFSTKQSQGTGLGLPVVRKVAEEHGGSLTYESEPGRGSTFRIHLPR